MTKALQDRLQQAEENDGTLRPLATMRPDEWIDLAYAHGAPDGVAMSPADYAGMLAAQVERQHPTTALAAHLVDGAPLSRHPLLAGVGTFWATTRHSTSCRPISTSPRLRKSRVASATPSNSVADSWRCSGSTLSVRAGAKRRPCWRTICTRRTSSSTRVPTQLAELLDGQLPPERIAALHERAAELHSVTFAAITAALSPLSAPDVLPDQRTSASR